MRKIDITTPQNVTIEYELATVLERSIAAILDIIFTYLGSFILYTVIILFHGGGYFFNYLYILIPVTFLYHLLMETLNHGQTLGKKIFKIRVVKINGERPVFFDFMMRSAFRFLDITSTLGTLALITISSSEKGQRLGDFFADTTVVKLMNIERISLQRILSMEKLKEYSPLYPEVIKFKEEEMLLVKESLERYGKYPNESNTEALNMLVKKIEGHLGVKAPANKVLFLNTIIKDYVRLTR
jgi:uncharacterized RDD family membrane protein YckC